VDKPKPPETPVDQVKSELIKLRDGELLVDPVKPFVVGSHHYEVGASGLKVDGKFMHFKISDKEVIVKRVTKKGESVDLVVTMPDGKTWAPYP